MLGKHTVAGVWVCVRVCPADVSVDNAAPRRGMTLLAEHATERFMGTVLRVIPH